jgi:hypothetical protein
LIARLADVALFAMVIGTAGTALASLLFALKRF